MFLVTGATGRVGRHVVNELLMAGQKVRALTRNVEGINLPQGVEVALGDLSQPHTLKRALEGVTGMHLITNGVGYVPLQTGQEIVELATKAGVRRVTVLWGGEKGLTEKAVEASNLEWTLLHPAEFMSNALKWKESIRSEGVVQDLFADSLSASIHEGDIGRVAAIALVENGHAGKTYVLTGPESLTVPQKVGIISKIINRDIRFVKLSEEQERERMRRMGVQEDAIDYVIRWHSNPPEYSYTVNSSVEKVTGRPARTFAEWATEHVNYFI
ncbi:uncharacterized protein YbjT (DUF2867 family) [Priestia taiwanensis]|uniref:Nucleotide-diphosphate-sugar epimerase n=2 Tax=Priestia taiwanensis TaxID=1347902 RepID=A0A917AJH7_9BACI|nr:uncharacterized protein YbjT (DUF2867 family) [Priestia taiwanensis]GGE57534.1 nucleotide-diphosphate-sugar epimerase [Priestia taiwanensis]